MVQISFFFLIQRLINCLCHINRLFFVTSFEFLQTSETAPLWIVMPIQRQWACVVTEGITGLQSKQSGEVYPGETD